jgi:hypothetical protein
MYSSSKSSRAETHVHRLTWSTLDLLGLVCGLPDSDVLAVARRRLLEPASMQARGRRWAAGSSARSASRTRGPRSCPGSPWSAFKQAHREVYLLTDAERTTGAYSNRF